MATVLLVDDEAPVRFTLSEVMHDRGHRVLEASSGSDALELIDQADAVLTDLAMPGMSGLELIEAIAARDPGLPVVLLTAHGSERVAVDAMKAGAYDYLSKPFDIDEVGLVMERAIETRLLRRENRRMNAERALGVRLIGEAPCFKRLLDAIARVAVRDVTVLIRGETGTGKELITSLVHALSARAGKPLVRFNCAAIPAELAESELFGHTRGAFTGAHAGHAGYFSRANGGTLVLDEIGEMPLAIQAKVLRALQNGEIQPVGSSTVDRVDVRIVASTNRDLRAETAAGRFREDLYYRLAVVELDVPPLRERREDIGPLSRELARKYSDKFGIGDVRISDELIAALAGRDWPGNVRELENTMARMVALSDGGTLTLRDLEAGAGAADLADPSRPTAGPGASLREQVEAFERRLIADALDSAGGNQSEAARRLGTSRATLIDKLHKYDLRGR